MTHPDSYGVHLRRFENACARYWQKDLDERVSDRRLRELHEAMEAARLELVNAIERELAARSGPKSESPDEWYEREKAAFIAWWESEGQKKFSETPTLAAGAGWLARADVARNATKDVA